MNAITFQNEIFGTVTTYGIGKLIVKSQEEFNIPHLHFITYTSESDSLYTTLCLELGIHHSGDKPLDSVELTLNSCLQYLNDTIKSKNDLDKLSALVSTKDFEDFWSLYRQCEVSLAKDKQDLGAQLIAHIETQVLKDFIDSSYRPDNIEFNPIKNVA